MFSSPRCFCSARSSVRLPPANLLPAAEAGRPTRAAPLIRAVKAAGYGAYILSNYPKELSETHWPKFRFLPEADGYIISALEKLAKPDPAIFRLLTTRFGLELSECIFIDDNPRNVEAAKKLGMEAIHFTGYDMLIRDLSEQYGIVIG